MDGVFMALVGVGGAVAAVGVYFGRKNLEQAEVLRNPIPFSRLQHNAGRCVALRGRPRGLRDMPYLWCKRTFQTYRTHVHHDNGKRHTHSSWKTDSVQEDGQPFVLESDGASVEVRDKPSEVHGTQTHHEGDTGGFLTLPGSRRVIVEVLPVGHQMTVCGRLTREGSGYVVRNDPSLGLLVSPHDTGRQASHEAMKGWLGVLGGPLVWLVATLFLYKQMHPM